MLRIGLLHFFQIPANGAMHMMLAAFMIFLISPSAPAQAPVAQFIYQVKTGVTCDKASSSEYSKLDCAQSVAAKQTQNVDALIEASVFAPIAAEESKRLECTISQARYLRDQPEMLSKAVDSTCKKLANSGDPAKPGFVETLNKISQLESQIDDEEKQLGEGSHWGTAATKLGRPCARASTCEEIQKRYEHDKLNLAPLLALAAAMRNSDVLLSSPEVYSKVNSLLKGSMFGTGAMTGDQVCQFLKQGSNAKSLVNAEVGTIKASQKEFEWYRSRGSWDSSKFKQTLWESQSRVDLMSKFSGDKQLQKSTFCRMEARYGEGAEIRDSIYHGAIQGGIIVGTILIPGAQLLAPVEAAGLGTDAVVAGAEALNAGSKVVEVGLATTDATEASTALRILKGSAEFAGWAGNLKEASDSCGFLGNIKAMSTENSCSQKDSAGLKKLLYSKIIDQSQCKYQLLLAASGAALKILNTVGKIGAAKMVAANAGNTQSPALTNYLSAVAKYDSATDAVARDAAKAEVLKQASGLTDADRLLAAEKTYDTGGPLTETQRPGFIDAHQEGADGNNGFVGSGSTYDSKQIAKKYRLQREANIAPAQARRYMDIGLTGKNAGPIDGVVVDNGTAGVALNATQRANKYFESGLEAANTGGKNVNQLAAMMSHFKKAAEEYRGSNPVQSVAVEDFTFRSLTAAPTVGRRILGSDFTSVAEDIKKLAKEADQLAKKDPTSYEMTEQQLHEIAQRPMGLNSQAQQYLLASKKKDYVYWIKREMDSMGESADRSATLYRKAPDLKGSPQYNVGNYEGYQFMRARIELAKEVEDVPGLGEEALDKALEDMQKYLKRNNIGPDQVQVWRDAYKRSEGF